MDKQSHCYYSVHNKSITIRFPIHSKQWFPTGVPRHTRVPWNGAWGAANCYNSSIFITTKPARGAALLLSNSAANQKRLGNTDSKNLIKCKHPLRAITVYVINFLWSWVVSSVSFSCVSENLYMLLLSFNDYKFDNFYNIYVICHLLIFTKASFTYHMQTQA